MSTGAQILRYDSEGPAMTTAALAQTRIGQAALGPGRPSEPQPRVTADSEAMREVWQRHGAVLMKFALRLTRGDKQRAEDIVQEALVRAWRHPEVVGSGQQPIRSWLFTITRHVAIDMWRARSRTEEILDDEYDNLPDPTEPIECATARSPRSRPCCASPRERSSRGHSTACAGFGRYSRPLLATRSQPKHSRSRSAVPAGTHPGGPHG